MKAGEVIVQSLIHAGIRYVAGVSGDSVLEILDAMYESPDIEYIPVRHEQVAVAIRASSSPRKRASTPPGDSM